MGPIVCKPRLLPSSVRFTWYADSGIKDTAEDAYGDPLTYLTTRELTKVDVSASSERNRAIWCMIRALDPQTPVVLYWH